MKIIIPAPDRALTGLEALQALQKKKGTDRKTFNKVVTNTRKGLGFGISIFATQRNRRDKTIFFDVAWSHPERFEGIEFTIFRYLFPDTEEGKVEMMLCRSHFTQTGRKGGESC